jgi:hypothetical protein
MIRFTLRLEIERRYRYFGIEQIYQDHRIERFKITGKDRSIIIQSNRPLIRGKGLKSFRITWQVVSGDVKHKKGLEPFINEIMKRVDSKL